MKRYQVTLSDQERGDLEKLVSTGRRSAQMLIGARLLLKADEAHEGRWSDQEMVAALDVSFRTVERRRQALGAEGLAAARSGQKRCRPGDVKFDGQKEAELISWACSPAPDGRERWTWQLLADKRGQLKVFDSISREAVRQVLKKTNSSRGSKTNGAFPRRPRPSVCGRGRRSWQSSNGCRIRSGRSCAGMKPASSRYSQLAKSRQRRADQPSGTTTNSNALG
jgi:hypothetical protein